MEKKAVMDSVNKFKKGKGERPSFIKQDDEDGSFPMTAARTGTPRFKEGSEAWKKRGLVDKSQKRKLKVYYVYAQNMQKLYLFEFILNNYTACTV